MIRKIAWVGGGVAAGAAAVCLIGCSRSTAAATVPAAAAKTVAVARVTRDSLDQTLTLVAEFVPFQEIDVHAKVAGYVQSINVDVGDRVQAGQLLAVLEIPELQDQIRQDEAVERRSQEEVRRAEADLRRAESARDIAHLGATRLAAVTKTRPNLVAQQEIDEAQARDQMAEAQVATSKAALAAASEQIAVAHAAQSHTRTLFSYARITAPFAGVITHRYADTGSMIQAGTASQSQAMPLVKLSQNSLLRLTVQVPESSVSQIHLGAPVDVRVQALGRTFPGKIARFADRVNGETRTMETEVDVPNPRLELIPGMYADASIVLQRAADVLVAPIESIDRDGDHTTTMVVTPAHALERRDVTLGLELPDRVEVKSGLAQGDEVVVGNRAGLKVGDTVTPAVVQESAEEKR
jgi:RND family efflux transporter MFP subunit